MKFLDLTLSTIEEDLALDEALLLEVEEGRESPLLRVWERPTIAVVLGASGRIDEDVIRETCTRDGIEIARRSSGGGTVVIGPGALNFSVILPRNHAPGLSAVDSAQKFVLDRVAGQIRLESQLPVEVLGSGDLTLGRRKFSGSAQRRLKEHFLIHATVLYSFPLNLIPLYTRPPRRQPEYREGRSHDDFVTNLPISRQQLVEILKNAWLASSPVDRPPLIPRDRVSQLVAEKFADPAWIVRL